VGIVQNVKRVGDRLHRVDPEVVHHGGLRGVLSGHEHALVPFLPRLHRHRQHAVDGTHGAVQGQLAREPVPIQHVRRDRGAAGGHPADRHRQVERRAFLRHVRRREVDGNASPLYGNVVVLEGGAHPVEALPHRRPRQPHDR